ncbi:unnamed protein product [Rhodiola kirilowii]
MGYESGSKAYRLYEPKSKKLHVSRDVIFDEEGQWNWVDWEPELVRSDETFTIFYQNEDVAGCSGGQSESEHVESHRSSPQTPHHRGTSSQQVDALPMMSSPHSSVADGKTSSSPSSKRPRRYRSLNDIYADTEVMDPYPPGCFLAVEEPTCFKEAEKEECWMKAMHEELKCIEDNETWELKDLPSGHKPIGLKWVYKVKKDSNGNIVKYKARLVAKGYVLRKGVDFDEVFVPVARMETVRLFIAVVAQEGWSIHHLDVKSAFLKWRIG